MYNCMSAYIISTTVIITALGCFVLQVRVSSTLYHMQLKYSTQYTQALYIHTLDTIFGRRQCLVQS